MFKKCFWNRFLQHTHPVNSNQAHSMNHWSGLTRRRPLCGNHNTFSYQASRAHHPGGPHLSATMSWQRWAWDGLWKTSGQQKEKKKELWKMTEVNTHMHGKISVWMEHERKNSQQRTKTSTRTFKVLFSPLLCSIFGAAWRRIRSHWREVIRSCGKSCLLSAVTLFFFLWHIFQRSSFRQSTSLLFRSDVTLRMK